MLSKRDLLQKLVGKKVRVIICDPIRIDDVPLGISVYNIITEVGSDVFAYETHFPAAAKKTEYLSINAVVHINVNHL